MLSGEQVMDFTVPLSAVHVCMGKMRTPARSLPDWPCPAADSQPCCRLPALLGRIAAGLPPLCSGLVSEMPIDEKDTQMVD